MKYGTATVNSKCFFSIYSVNQFPNKMKKVVLGFSGGLDTSFCVKYLGEDQGYEVHSIIVNTGGFSDEELKQVEKSRLLISTKGTIVKREWRSGYYYIAKELDGYLMAVGLDYERKAVFVSKEISHSEGELIVKEFLMKQLGEVVPLFPEEEVVSIRPHVESERGVMSFRRMLAVGLVVVLGVIKLY